MNLYRYQYQMARTLIEERNPEGTPLPSEPLAQSPKPNSSPGWLEPWRWQCCWGWLGYGFMA